MKFNDHVVSDFLSRFFQIAGSTTYSFIISFIRLLRIGAFPVIFEEVDPPWLIEKSNFVK